MMDKLESTYFSKLDLKAKEQYEEKIKLIENVDPYTLQKEAFTANIDYFPKVTPRYCQLFPICCKSINERAVESVQKP